MIHPVRVPQLGVGQTTATVVGWLREVGDRLERGDPVVELEVEKATVDVEVFASGVLVERVSGPGDVVDVGQVIAYVSSSDEASAASAVARTDAGP